MTTQKQFARLGKAVQNLRDAIVANRPRPILWMQRRWRTRRAALLRLVVLLRDRDRRYRDTIQKTRSVLFRIEISPDTVLQRKGIGRLIVQLDLVIEASKEPKAKE